MFLLKGDKLLRLEQFGEDTTELALTIKESFGIELTTDDLVQANTVGELSSCIVEKVGSLFDQTQLKHAVVVISELLAAHGHQFATVKPTYEPNPFSNTVTLVFNIDEGPKAQKSRNRS
jgi:outer membrane protein assembly factor BamA